MYDILIIMNEKTPPPNLSLKESTDWWRKNGASMNNIETTSDLERICSRCHAINPCTGVDTCIQCEESLDGAKRTKESSQHSPGSQNW